MRGSFLFPLPVDHGVWLRAHGHLRVAKVKKVLILLGKFRFWSMENPALNRCNSIAGPAFVTACKGGVSSPAKSKASAGSLRLID